MITDAFDPSEVLFGPKDFYGWDLYDFLVTGDVIDQEIYDASGLAGANHDMDKLYIAIEMAKRI